MNSALQEILQDLQRQYPLARLSDYVKLIYQNEFGCGHLVTDPARALEQLRAECATAQRGARLFESVGNGCRRVYLRNALELGASPRLLHRMMLASAQKTHGTEEGLLQKLLLLQQLCDTSRLPFSGGLCRLYLSNYEAAGCPALHHSDAYRAAYAPAYRLIFGEYARFFELFLRLERMLKTTQDPILVAIDGPCASGKTTLAALLQTCFDCSIFHTDDFFLRPEQRTPARLHQCGGNMDRERLEAEVLAPLTRHSDVFYRAYDCKTQRIGPGTPVPFRRINLIEGSYSMHPALRRYYSLSVALTVSPECQLARLRRRESPESLKRFQALWIPMEQAYAKGTDLFHAADLCYSCDDTTENEKEP